MLIRKSLSIFVLVTVFSMTTVTADQTTKCKEVIKAADAAIAAKNKELSLANLAIKECQENSAVIRTENNALMESNSRWYHNPVVMFVFGAAAGTVAYMFVKK